MENSNRSPICSIIILITIGLVADAQRERRITGGEVAKQCEFPYSLRLLVIDKDFNLDVCGGALISLRHVATAAHCLYNVQRAVVHCGIINVDDPSVKRIPFAKTFLHPNYKLPEGLASSVSRYDIAVGVLNESIIKDHQAIKPIALPTTPVERSKPHIFSGWGNIDKVAESKILRKMTVKVWAKEDCVQEPVELCGSSDNADFCHGDSGSPLVYADKLVGIATRTSCRIGRLHVYTNVYHFIDWINEKMGQS